MKKIFAILFILTGFFAIIGGLYTWGEGSILKQNELVKVLIPWADIVLTGPLSIVSGFGLLKNKSWAKVFSLNLSGIYVFGSILVFTSIIWNNDFSIYLIVPSLTGFLIGLSYTILVWRDSIGIKKPIL